MQTDLTDLTESTNGVTLNDIAELNEAYFRYVEDLSLRDLQKRIDEVSVSTREIERDPTRAREVLDIFGILVIPESAPSEICAYAADSMVDLCSAYARHGVDTYEDEQALYQVGTSKLKGYRQLSTYGKTIINVRRGQDEGMLDVFNCDLALPDQMGALRRVFEDPSILHILNRPNLRPRNLNTYVNEGITRTRGFHVDSYSEHLKAFIYLSDVPSLEDGPYTFVKRSHGDSAFRRVNRALCDDMTPATETPVIDPLAITPVLAPKGSLVISDQSGSHRGWPQSPGRQRACRDHDSLRASARIRGLCRSGLRTGCQVADQSDRESRLHAF